MTAVIKKAAAEMAGKTALKAANLVSKFKQN